MDAKPTLENMKLLGILDMIEKMLLADAFFEELRGATSITIEADHTDTLEV